jgi:hypothetical protein
MRIAIMAMILVLSGCTTTQASGLHHPKPVPHKHQHHLHIMTPWGTKA